MLAVAGAQVQDELAVRRPERGVRRVIGKSTLDLDAASLASPGGKPTGQPRKPGVGTPRG
jgi:hypothetical protein